MRKDAASRRLSPKPCAAERPPCQPHEQPLCWWHFQPSH